MGIISPPIPGESTVIETSIAEAVKRKLLSATLPAAAVEHTAASYEIEPSATKGAFVFIRAVSKSATTCEYNVVVGGVTVTQILDPSITGSIDVTITVYVPPATKLAVNKVLGELEKSFTTIQTMN